MITCMLTYEIFIFVLVSHFYDSMPVWLRMVLLVSFFIINIIACTSEQNLRDMVEELKKKNKNKENKIEGEWISVDERLPEESSYYYVKTKAGTLLSMYYSTKYNMFNVYDWNSIAQSKAYNIKVTHWMPLPEAPKMKGGE